MIIVFVVGLIVSPALALPFDNGTTVVSMTSSCPPTKEVVAPEATVKGLSKAVSQLPTAPPGVESNFYGEFDPSSLRGEAARMLAGLPEKRKRKDPFLILIPIAGGAGHAVSSSGFWYPDRDPPPPVDPLPQSTPEAPTIALIALGLIVGAHRYRRQ